MSAFYYGHRAMMVRVGALVLLAFILAPATPVFGPVGDVQARFESRLEPMRHEQRLVNHRFSRNRLWDSLALVGSNFLGNSWVKSGPGSVRRRCFSLTLAGFFD
jgi:hypothetical protein